MTEEKEIRERKTPWPKTIEELNDYIRSLLDEDKGAPVDGNQYGVTVYKVSLATTACFNFMSNQLGITGFQSGAAGLDVLGRIRNMKRFCIQNYDNLLFPQYCNEEHFPTYVQLIEKNIEWLSEEAAKRIEKAKPEEYGYVHPDVVKWWEFLARKGGRAYDKATVERLVTAWEEREKKK